MPCNCSRCCKPNLLEQLCPSRVWERDLSKGCGCVSRNECGCGGGGATGNVRARFGLAWIAETPFCSCQEPCGWQVEFVDTPSKVEQRCKEMIEWVNSPPLSKKEEPQQSGRASKEEERAKERRQQKKQDAADGPADEKGCKNKSCPSRNKLPPQRGCKNSCCLYDEGDCCCCVAFESRSRCNTEDAACDCQLNEEPVRDSAALSPSCCPCPCNEIRSANDVEIEEKDKTSNSTEENRSMNKLSDMAVINGPFPPRRTSRVESLLPPELQGKPPVTPQFMVQSGDIINQDGTGGESIYGDTFDDENFTLLHQEEGRVGMANSGPNTNSSQFYITTVPCIHLDNRNVVFGQVRKGLNIIREMSEVPRAKDRPQVKCIIDDCGEFKSGEPWRIEENDCTGDVYPPWPNDWDIDAENMDESRVEEAITNIKESGNYYFKRKNYVDSARKYKKALRYIDWLRSSSRRTDMEHINAVKTSALSNLAAVKLKSNRYKEAVSLCNEALNLEPNNGKALYRRGQGQMGLKEYDRAIADLNEALKIFPNDASIQLSIKTAKKYKKSYLDKERKFFAKCFNESG